MVRSEMKRPVDCLVFVLFCMASSVGCSRGNTCEGKVLDALEQAPRFAAIDSDYSTSAVMLLKDDGTVLRDAWLTSGSTTPGLRTTLSGDVMFANVQPVGELVIIDRLGTDVVTRIAVPSGQVIAQWPVGRLGERSFRANPYDALALGDGRWLVTRHEPNLTPDAPDALLGDDVIVLDATGTLMRRINLEQFRVVIDGVMTYARPTQMWRMGNFVVVALARLSADFRKAAMGAAALIRLDDFTVNELDFKGLTNCGEVRGADERSAWVLCGGTTFADVATRRMDAGLVRLVLDERAVIVRDVWPASRQQDESPPTNGLVPIDDARVVVVAYGDKRAGENDRLLLYDANMQRATTLVQASDAFVLGDGVWDSASQSVCVPDAILGLRRLLLNEAGALAPSGMAEVSSCHGLPLRALTLMH